MAFDWFSLHDIHPIEGFLGKHSSGAPWVPDWESWRSSFVIGVTIEGRDRAYSFRVDALPLLYGLLAATTDFTTRGSFRVRFGDEDIVLNGTSESQFVVLKVGFEDGGTDHVMAVDYLSASDAALFLTRKSAELSECLAKTGINLERLLSEYPLQGASAHY